MKIKPKFISLLLTSLILFTFSWNTYWDNERIVSKITTRYCNDKKVTTRLNLNEIEVNKDYEICLALLNSFDTDLTVLLNFVDWAIEKKTWNVTCLWENAIKKWISKYIKFPSDSKYNNLNEDTWSLVITVKPWETIQKIARINLPSEFNWKLNACLTTQVSDIEVQKWKINIQVRKANVLSVIAKWTINKSIEATSNIKTKTWNDIITKNDKMFIIKKEDWSYLIWTKIKNVWNVKLKINTNLSVDLEWYLWNIKWSIFNIEWKREKIIEWESFEILPWEEKILTQELKDFPIIWLWLNSKLNINYLASLDYESDETKKENKEDTKSLEFKFNIFPWEFVVIFILIFVIIFSTLYFFNKKKKTKKNK